MKRAPLVLVKARHALTSEASVATGGFCVSEDQTKISAARGAELLAFTFNHVYQPHENVADFVGDDLVAHVLDRNNACVLAYGQSGSGKSHTMLGCGGVADSGGLIQKLLSKLIAVKPAAWQLRLGCLEVYRDLIHDLSDPSDRSLRLRVADGVPFLQDLTTVEVRTVPEMEAVVAEMVLKRRTGSTGLNDRSSRSHLVMRAELCCNGVSLCRLDLVDLAGSERVSASHCTGELFEDAKQINLSLTVLGNIISNLQSENSSSFQRYRDHKLTHLLQPSLMCYAVFICCVNPANFNESMNTLQFAARAKSMTAQREVPLTDVQRLRQEVALLKQRIKELDSAHTSGEVIERPVVLRRSLSSCLAASHLPVETSPLTRSLSVTRCVPRPPPLNMKLGRTVSSLDDLHQLLSEEDDSNESSPLLGQTRPAVRTTPAATYTPSAAERWALVESPPAVYRLPGRHTAAASRSPAAPRSPLLAHSAPGSRSPSATRSQVLAHSAPASRSSSAALSPLLAHSAPASRSPLLAHSAPGSRPSSAARSPLVAMLPWRPRSRTEDKLLLVPRCPAAPRSPLLAHSPAARLPFVSKLPWRPRSPTEEKLLSGFRSPAAPRSPLSAHSAPVSRSSSATRSPVVAKLPWRPRSPTEEKLLSGPRSPAAPLSAAHSPQASMRSPHVPPSPPSAKMPLPNTHVPQQAEASPTMQSPTAESLAGEQTWSTSEFTEDTMTGCTNLDSTANLSTAITPVHVRPLAEATLPTAAELAAHEVTLAAVEKLRAIVGDSMYEKICHLVDAEIALLEGGAPSVSPKTN